MASVKKCDICGKIYDIYPSEKTLHITMQEEKTQNRSFVINEGVDCCPECSKLILNLVEIMKNDGSDYAIIIEPRSNFDVDDEKM